MFEKPTYYIAPNDFVDVCLKDLTGAETKILAVIIRKTFGFHKDTDYLSISKLMEYTGLSNRVIIIATSTLEQKDFIHIKYQCPNCKSEFDHIDDMMVDEFYYNKKREKQCLGHRFSCTICQAKEHPNKFFSLSMSEECATAMKNGYEESSQPVMKKSHNGYEEKSQPVVTKSHNGYEEKSQGVVTKSHTQKETYTKGNILKETDTKDLSDDFDISEDFINAEQVDARIEKLEKTCKLIQGTFNQFTIQSQPIKEALIKISEYPEEQQIKALEKGSLESNQKKIVSYMLNGLKQGWYDNQAQPKESNPNEVVYNHPPLVVSSTPEQLEQEQKEREIQKTKNRIFLDRVKEIENTGVHFLTAMEMAGKEFGFGDDKV